MLALRRVGALLSLRRLPVLSIRPQAALITLPLHVSQLQQTRGVKSSRSSKSTDSSTNSSTNATTATRTCKGSKDSSPPINAAFFKVDGATPPAYVDGADAAEGEGWVVGEVTDHAIDLHDVRPVRTPFPPSPPSPKAAVSPDPHFTRPPPPLLFANRARPLTFRTN